MHQGAQLARMVKWPPLKDYLIKNLREKSKPKKPVKGIDEDAIMARLKAYNERWEREGRPE